MSIALENNRIERSGFHQMSRIVIYESPESARFAGVDRLFMVPEGRRDSEAETSSSSSSIGRNSDRSSNEGRSLDGDGSSVDGEEVQSQLKGPLDCLDALEEVLPVKRGISKFYCGKSKSFTSLADAASCSTIKDIAKPGNALTRKRKNLLAYSNFFHKNCNHLSRSNGGISKRPANSSRNALAFPVTMSSYESTNNSQSSNSNSLSPKLCLPPLPPHSRRYSDNKELSSSPPTQNFSPWRSFSLSDLQSAAAATPSTTGILINNRLKEGKLH